MHAIRCGLITVWPAFIHAKNRPKSAQITLLEFIRGQVCVDPTVGSQYWHYPPLSSGAVAQTVNIARALAAANLHKLGTDRRNRQTDTVPLHRRLLLEAASVNNQQNPKRSNLISTVNFLRFVKRYARCKDFMLQLRCVIDLPCERNDALTSNKHFFIFIHY